MKRKATSFVALALGMCLLYSDADAYNDADVAKLKATNACEKCDLSGVNLASANLRQARLAGANLSNANLHKADLTGADLSTAVLTNANLGCALWINGVRCDNNSNGSCQESPWMKYRCFNKDPDLTQP